MFSHNLAKQLKRRKKLTLTSVLVLMLLASVIIICWLQVSVKNATELAVEPSIAIADSGEPDNEETKQDCTNYENQYVLLGITFNQRTAITLVRQTLTGKALFITNDDNSNDELNLVSANLSQAIFQMYSCRFTLLLPEQ